MTGSSSAGPGARRIERTLSLDAPVDAVWKALTDATELMRWFPMRARVVPGAGGLIHMQWDETYDAESRIEIWEPNHHLRIGFPHHDPVLLATDYHLESEKGQTVLRVVTSGFGEGADWDDWYAGVGAGWDFELYGLRHYLEHHRGLDRIVATARAPFTLDRAAAWRGLLGPGGWLEIESGVPRAGGRAVGRTGSGTRLSGTVLLWTPPTQLVMTVEEYNNAILRVEVERGDHAIVWMATYGVAEGTIAALSREWQQGLRDGLD